MLSLLTTVWQVQKAPYPTILEWTHVFTTMVFIIYCISKHVAPAVHLVYYIKQRQRNPTGQYRMHNPKKLAAFGTQDRRGNTEYTTQKHWQHWVHKTDGAIQNAQPRDTGNIGYAGHRTKINKKKHNTENHKDDQHEPHQKSGAKPGAREVSCSCILQDTSSFYYWYLRFRKGS